MKQIFFILLFSNFLSCNENSQANEKTRTAVPSNDSKSSTITEQSVEDVSGCYMKIVGRDTAILMLEQKGRDLSGKMLYDNFEKDGSRGVVKGKEEVQILKLWYDFEAEGTHSIMEVYFKKDNGRLLRGIGSMDVKTDTTYFTSGANYSDKEAFNKVDCNLIKWKFE